MNPDLGLLSHNQTPHMARISWSWAAAAPVDKTSGLHSAAGPAPVKVSYVHPPGKGHHLKKSAKSDAPIPISSGSEA